jgi:Na+-transporting NADH:ubiquinone oxidoreductase subunit NqrC
MPLKLFENDRTNKIVLFIILIALITASAILVSIVVMYLVSLEETGGG